MDKLYEAQEKELTAAFKLISHYKKENKWLWFCLIIAALIIVLLIMI